MSRPIRTWAPVEHLYFYSSPVPIQGAACKRHCPQKHGHVDQVCYKVEIERLSVALNAKTQLLSKQGQVNFPLERLAQRAKTFISPWAGQTLGWCQLVKVWVFLKRPVLWQFIFHLHWVQIRSSCKFFLIFNWASPPCPVFFNTRKKKFHRLYRH